MNYKERLEPTEHKPGSRDEMLRTRVAELEAALGSVRDWAAKQHQRWLEITALDEEDDDEEVMEAIEDGWAPCCGGSHELLDILTEVLS